MFLPNSLKLINSDYKGMHLSEDSVFTVVISKTILLVDLPHISLPVSRHWYVEKKLERNIFQNCGGFLLAMYKAWVLSPEGSVAENPV